MIVVDASVLIGFLESDDAHHLHAVALLERTVDDDLAAHPLTIAEVLVVPARTGQLELVSAVLRELGVAECPFPANTARRLAELRATTRLKMPDCCVLLSAEGTGGAVATFDDALAAAARLLGLEVVGR